MTMIMIKKLVNDDSDDEDNNHGHEGRQRGLCWLPAPMLDIFYEIMYTRVHIA